MRCLTLARAMAARGWCASFLLGPAGRRLLEVFGWQGAIAEGSLEAAAKADVLVLDNYRLEAAAEAPLRASGSRVVVIDDLADRLHACDLLVDASFERRVDDYAALARGAQVLAGPAYALLRPEFAAARPQALVRRDAPVVGRALVSLGLTDLGGVTRKVVEALMPVMGEVELDILLGPRAESLDRLQALADGDPRLRLHLNATNVEALMTRADVAVGAGGSSTWERACLGLPSLSLVLADNQSEMAMRLGAAGVALPVEARTGDFGPALLACWRRLVEDRALRRRLARRSAELCDGLGAERVADAIEALSRPQTPSSASPES